MDIEEKKSVVEPVAAPAPPPAPQAEEQERKRGGVKERKKRKPVPMTDARRAQLAKAREKAREKANARRAQRQTQTQAPMEEEYEDKRIVQGNGELADQMLGNLQKVTPQGDKIEVKRGTTRKRRASEMEGFPTTGERAPSRLCRDGRGAVKPLSTN